ncbi:MAG: MFS transporter [Planctomycetota bacterium]
MPERERFIRRNYWLGVLNGSLVMGGFSFLNVQAVVAVFLLRLGASPVMVGLVSALSFGTMMLLPLPLAPLVEQAEHKRRYYWASTTGRVLTLSGLVGAVLVLRGAPAWLLGGVVVAVLVGYRAALSVGLLPFYEIVAHSVPARRRGGFFALRRMVGNVLKVGGAFVVGYLLDEGRSGLGFPGNYAAVFACGLLLSGAGSLAFCFVHEPPMHVDRRQMGLVAKLREGLAASRRDARFRRLIVVQLAGAAMMLARPFVVVYCLRVLGVLEPGAGRGGRSEGQAVQVFLLASAVTFLAANPLWAHVSDRVGNATLLRAAYLSRVAAAPLALVLPVLPGPALQWVGAVALVVVMNATRCGVKLGELNYMLEMAPPEQRPRYVAMWKVALAPMAIGAPLLGGWLAAACDAYWPCFALAGAFAVAAAVLALGLEEPRGRSLTVQEAA